MATINDLVLVHIDSKPGFFARIENIVPDVKPGWWQVKLLVLTMPMQIYTWILDEAQIKGAPFTMGGTPVLLEKIEPHVPDEPAPTPKPAEEGKVKPGKVVSLLERKKEK